MVEILDGDEIRKVLSRDLGLSKEHREEHARRVSFVAKLLSRNGVVSIVALISPSLRTTMPGCASLRRVSKWKRTPRASIFS